MFTGLVLFLVFWCPAVHGVTNSDQDPPLCLSRYDYDYKILTNIVVLEQKVEALQKAMETQKEEITKQEKTDIVTPGSGSTYVRWGRTSCLENDTETVYTGNAAGSYYTHSGAAANYLCLPTTPLWGKYDDTQNAGARIYGAEYEIRGSYSNTIFKKNLGGGDVPCAVCRTVRPSVLMIPGRNVCYDGWSIEYTGYLAAGQFSHSAASEYICLDADPEIIKGTKTSLYGKLMYLTGAKVGTLPCPPYVEGRELTCVVCSL